MGQPVVHFEVLGNDGDKLRGYYGELFGWEFDDVMGPMDYAVVQRDGNTNAEGIGIGGGVGATEGEDHVTFYVEVPDIEVGLANAERLGGKRLSGPDEVPGAEIAIGHIADPEGHVIGLVSPTS
jgi:uncharacterized protein